MISTIKPTMKILFHKIGLILLILILITPFSILNGIRINDHNMTCLNGLFILEFVNHTVFDTHICQDNLECLQKLCIEDADGIYIQSYPGYSKQYEYVAIPHQHYHIITFIIICVFSIVIFNLAILYIIYESLTYRKTITIMVVTICLFLTISTLIYCISVHSKTVNNLGCLGNISLTGYGYPDDGWLEPITETRYCSDIGCFTGNTSTICKDECNRSVISTKIVYGKRSTNEISLVPISDSTINIFLYLCIAICVPICFYLFILTNSY